MKKADFGRFVGISRQMVSKYAEAGRLALVGGRVAARASLMRLEGHLDEGKRRAALLRLAGIDPGFAGGLMDGAAGPPPPSDAAGKTEAAGAPRENVIDLGARSAKARADEARARLLEIELDKALGNLLCAEEVKRVYQDTIAVYWSEIDRIIRPASLEIAAALKLDAAAAAEHRRLIEERLIKRLRENIVEAMERLIEETGPRAPEAPARPVAPAQT